MRSATHLIFKNWLLRATLLCLILSLADILALHATHSLLTQVESAKRSKIIDQTLRIGTKVPILNGNTSAGTRITVTFPAVSHRKTLLLVFTPQCADSNRIWPEWQARVTKLPPNRYRAVAVDVIGMTTTAYLTNMHMTIPTIVAVPDPLFVLAMRLRATPQMIEIDEAGYVRNVWTGVRQIQNAPIGQP